MSVMCTQIRLAVGLVVLCFLQTASAQANDVLPAVGSVVKKFTYRVPLCDTPAQVKEWLSLYSESGSLENKPAGCYMVTYTRGGTIELERLPDVFQTKRTVWTLASVSIPAAPTERFYSWFARENDPAL